MGLSSRRIDELVRQQGLCDLESLAATGAGAGCGSCRPELEEILADAAGTPVADAVRRANRARNGVEAWKRVEAALFGAIAPRLPRGTELALVSVEGLRVELHLRRGDPEVTRLIAERLRKLVCAELEVVFG
jgi:bacterioferritin-associated ferredoxin